MNEAVRGMQFWYVNNVKGMQGSYLDEEVIDEHGDQANDDNI